MFCPWQNRGGSPARQQQAKPVHEGVPRVTKYTRAGKGARGRERGEAPSPDPSRSKLRITAVARERCIIVGMGSGFRQTGHTFRVPARKEPGHQQKKEGAFFAFLAYINHIEEWAKENT